MGAKILLIEDDESYVLAIRLMLRKYPIEIVWAKSGQEGIQVYKNSFHQFATVIIDYCLPDFKGSDVAQHLRRLNPSQDFLFASGHRDPEFLIDLLETGGSSSFLAKGKPNEEIRPRILESIALYESKHRVVGRDSYLPGEVEQGLKSMGFIGRSKAMAEVLEKIKKYRESPYPTLIVGETGTGKELVAQALVPSGKRMIAISCPSFTDKEHLLESELFGYVKGAFTGALQDTSGLIAQAHGNVLFLDELHTLSISAQSKLLRFLQEMKYRRVGDHSGREVSVQFKLVSAAKPDIYDRVKSGQFLEDLLYRVRQIQLVVPPLRERTEDIEPLVRHLQDAFNEGKPTSAQKQFRISTIEKMKTHPWKANVRQLQGAVRQMLTDANSDIVDPSDFDTFLKSDGSVPPALSVSGGIDLERSTSNFEADQIVLALKRSRTQRGAAEKLGLSRWGLNRKMLRLGIQPEAYLLKA